MPEGYRTVKHSSKNVGSKRNTFVKDIDNQVDLFKSSIAIGVEAIRNLPVLVEELENKGKTDKVTELFDKIQSVAKDIDKFVEEEKLISTNYNKLVDKKFATIDAPHKLLNIGHQYIDLNSRVLVSVVEVVSGISDIVLDDKETENE